MTCFIPLLCCFGSAIIGGLLGYSVGYTNGRHDEWHIRNDGKES